MTVDVILPCLDEAAALPWVLGRLPDGYRAVVVDNGSTDGSAAVARSTTAENSCRTCGCVNDRSAGSVTVSTSGSYGPPLPNRCRISRLAS